MPVEAGERPVLCAFVLQELGTLLRSEFVQISTRKSHIICRVKFATARPVCSLFVLQSTHVTNVVFIDTHGSTKLGMLKTFLTKPVIVLWNRLFTGNRIKLNPVPVDTELAVNWPAQ